MIYIVKVIKKDIVITLHNIYYTHIYIHKLRDTETHYSYN